MFGVKSPVAGMGPGGPPAPPAAPSPPPPAPRVTQSGPLATLVGRGDKFKGQRFPIRVPVVNVGRADYNDIVLNDESVSTVHAKLQRREGVWVLVDLDSTNGSFVDGEKVSGESSIVPGSLLRFGAVGVMFESTDDTLDPAKGSSTKMLQAIKLPPKPGGGA